MISYKIKDGRFIELLRRYVFKNKPDTQIINALYLCADYLSKIYSKNYVRIGNDFIMIAERDKKSSLILLNDLLNENKIILKEETHLFNLNDDRISFLEHDLVKKKDGNITFKINRNAMNDRLKIYKKNGNSVCNGKVLNYPLSEIISIYNREMDDFKEFYCLASDLSIQFKKFRYFQYFSLLKTLGCKEKISVQKVIMKYGIIIKPRNREKTRRIIEINNCRYAGFEN